MSEAEPTPRPVPAWATDLIALYESGSTSQFILYGNVYDRVPIPRDGKLSLGSLSEFIREVLLQRFDVILSYDLGSGLRVEKGESLFTSWPYFQTNPNLPREPLLAADTLTHYFRYAANLSQVAAELRPKGIKAHLQIGCLIHDAHLLAPASSGGGSYQESALLLQLRAWATENLLTAHPIATFLFCENLNDLHPLLVNNPRAGRLKIPLPNSEDLKQAMGAMLNDYPTALKNYANNLITPAEQLVGAQLGTIEGLLKRKEYDVLGKTEVGE